MYNTTTPLCLQKHNIVDAYTFEAIIILNKYMFSAIRIWTKSYFFHHYKIFMMLQKYEKYLRLYNPSTEQPFYPSNNNNLYLFNQVQKKWVAAATLLTLNLILWKTQCKDMFLFANYKKLQQKVSIFNKNCSFSLKMHYFCGKNLEK